MTNEKPKTDSAKIDSFLKELKQQSWLRNRNWWVDFLFHFTDIINAVNVLNNGFLFSRQEAQSKNLLEEDSASTKIISQTNQKFTDYVRFYFRPLTPTAYLNEGFRPLDKLYQGAHCPVPVYLLFNLRKVLALYGARFSNGSLARREHEIFDSLDDFIRLPFQDIYHNSSWSHEDPRQDEIKNRRHAEVIVPKSISLNHLEFIVCRSQAEYETLYNLLSTSVWQRWKTKVAVSKQQQLFNREWLYVKEVALEGKSANFQFNSPNNKCYFGPFNIRVDFINNKTNGTYFFEQRLDNIVAEMQNVQLSLDLSNLNLVNYTARLTIDDKLAYLGRYTGDDIPF